MKIPKKLGKAPYEMEIIVKINEIIEYLEFLQIEKQKNENMGKSGQANDTHK